MYNYQTGEFVKYTTPQDYFRSRAQEEIDGGRGIIDYNGMSVFVVETGEENEHDNQNN
jgi:hypothetical protein